MKRTAFDGMKCSIARTLNLIGEWWTPLILRDIFYGVRRFEGLLAHLGISRNILTDRLQSLVDGGILERRQYQSNPDRFEYWLTEKGIDLYPILISLMAWGDRWLLDDQDRLVELIHKECGKPARPEVVCSHCRSEITARNVRARILSEELSKELEALRRPAEQRRPEAGEDGRNGKAAAAGKASNGRARKPARAAAKTAVAARKRRAG